MLETDINPFIAALIAIFRKRSVVLNLNGFEGIYPPYSCSPTLNGIRFMGIIVQPMPVHLQRS